MPMMAGTPLDWPTPILAWALSLTDAVEAVGVVPPRVTFNAEVGVTLGVVLCAIAFLLTTRIGPDLVLLALPDDSACDRYRRTESGIRRLRE